MGSQKAATCLDCGDHFTVNDGGGFKFHQLRCVLCGRDTFVGFDELGDLHVRYLKGSAMPYTVASAGEHEYIRKHVDVEPLSSEKYYEAVAASRKCECGGDLSFSAPARCPQCGSTHIEEGFAHILYD